MKKSFAKMGKFNVIASLRVKTPEEAKRDIADGERQGADGFLLHAELLETRYRNACWLDEIFRATKKPVMILNYRTEKKEDFGDLSELLVGAVKAGAAAADVPMSYFDEDPKKSLAGRKESFAGANPADVTMDESAAAKQKELISGIHAAGGEVLMSAHVGTMLTAEQALKLSQEMESRGADIAKIILNAKSLDDVSGIYQTIRVLKKELKIPFLYQSMGTYGKLVRPTAWIFGSRYVLCHNRYTELSNREKPLIEDVMKIKNGLWSEGFEQ